LHDDDIAEYFLSPRGKTSFCEAKPLCQDTECNAAPGRGAGCCGRARAQMPHATAAMLTRTCACRCAHLQADIEAVKAAVADDAVSAEQLKEKVEALKKSSMKIGEAMYKNADGGAGGEQSAEYEEVKKDGEGDKKEEKKD
jgi:Tfp pilus assembly protein PilX